jgi:hypothetical protein
MIHREYLFSEGPLIRITHASRHHAHLCRGNTAVSQDFKSAEAAAVMQPERTYILDILSRAGGKGTQRFLPTRQKVPARRRSSAHLNIGVRLLGPSREVHLRSEPAVTVKPGQEHIHA